MALDTYEREVERYGGPESIDRAERAFAADSQAVADLLRLRARGRLRLERTLLAVTSLDLLLQGLGLPAAERLAWARGVRGHEAASSSRRSRVSRGCCPTRARARRAPRPAARRRAARAPAAAGRAT